VAPKWADPRSGGRQLEAEGPLAPWELGADPADRDTGENADLGVRRLDERVRGARAKGRLDRCSVTTDLRTKSNEGGYLTASYPRQPVRKERDAFFAFQRNSKAKPLLSGTLDTAGL